jgi:hypothetical protein
MTDEFAPGDSGRVERSGHAISPGQELIVREHAVRPAHGGARGCRIARGSDQL